MAKQSLLIRLRDSKNENDIFDYDIHSSRDQTHIYKFFKELETEGKISLNMLQLSDDTHWLKAEGKYLSD
ncbi:MAG: hypothetical protein ABRQ25_08820 [Clostridiaceae bacterium]